VQVHKKLGNTHLALINFSWATDLDPKGTNNHIKEALDKRCMVDDDDDDDDNASNLCTLPSWYFIANSGFVGSIRRECQRYTHVSSSYRSTRLGLSHWDPYAMHRGGCLELYYCNMVEWSW